MAPDVFELPTLDRRRFCECCGYPSLFLPDNVDGTPEWDAMSTSCDLCEWESVRLTPDGEPRESSEEERNDGLTLDAARERLERYRSIYDPAELPVWKLSPPSDAVNNARDVLRSAYQDVMAVPLPERWSPWAAVLVAERALFDALRTQREDEQALFVDDAFDDDEPADDET